jgi:hypothetical protein
MSGMLNKDDLNVWSRGRDLDIFYLATFNDQTYSRKICCHIQKKKEEEEGQIEVLTRVHFWQKSSQRGNKIFCSSYDFYIDPLFATS